MVYHKDFDIVLLLVDHYYLPLSATFNRGHDSHFIMIYDYDDINRKVFLVDNQTNKGCYTAELSYEEIEKTYYGCIQHCIDARIKYQSFWPIPDLPDTVELG